MNAALLGTRADLWHNNAVLAHLLGLSPLLAVSTSAVTALGLALATLLVLAASALTVTLLRRNLSPLLRWPVFMLIIATFATCIELLMQAWTLPLYAALGLFVPLLAANSLIVARAHLYASCHPPLAALRDGLATGAGFGAVLLILGVLREALGTGQVFANMHYLLPFAGSEGIRLFAADASFLLALLPAGGFVLLGLLLALKNVIDNKRHAMAVPPAMPAPGSKRVRITGKV